MEYMGIGREIAAFNSKASAMSFAIRMTTTVDMSGRTIVDYSEAKKLYDFICASVNLPDVERDAMSEVADMLTDLRKEVFRASE